MTHSGYILAAYLAAALVIGGLAVWVYLDGRAQKRKLQRLEADGVRRRGTARPGGQDRGAANPAKADPVDAKGAT